MDSGGPPPHLACRAAPGPRAGVPFHPGACHLGAMDYRNALITGASSGLGAGLVRRLSARGTRVYAAARRKDRLEQLAAECGPGEVVPVVLDVADTAKVVETLRRIDGECGGLDLIVANAGIGGNKRATRLTWEKQVEPVLRINVLGAFATLTAVLPAMVERDRGHLVGIGSLAGARGLPGTAAYSASKAALATYLETLRVDLKRTGVKVTTIEPGFVKTELTEGNPRPMPFLMDLDAAVDDILHAIDRQRAVRGFPWPLVTAVKLARMLPRAVYDQVVTRVG